MITLKEIMAAHTQTPTGKYFLTYEEAVQDKIDCDPEYVGEAGLMKAYEDYADVFKEVKIKGRTYWTEVENV